MVMGALHLPCSVQIIVIIILCSLLSAAEIQPLFSGTGGGDNVWISLQNEIDDPHSSSLSGARPHDLFGWSVALSADASTVAIGAIDNDDNGSASGHVRIYQLARDLGSDNSSGNDKEVVPLGTIQGAKAGDYSGYSISLSHNGSIIAIGSPGHQRGAGKASIFHRLNQGDWSLLGSNGNIELESTDPSSAGAGLGHVVALSQDGHTVVVGAPYYDQDRGGVWVLRYSSNKDLWEPVGEMLVGDTRGAQFGYSVAISGDASILAVGAKNHPGLDNQQSSTSSSRRNNVGQVQVFHGPLSGDDKGWRMYTTSLHGDNIDDYFGFALSLTADGTRLVIGSPYCDTSIGRDTGRVEVYQLVPETEVTGDDATTSTPDNGDCSVYWASRLVPVGKPIVGNKPGDLFGYSVSIADNGRRIAVGARQVDGLKGQVTVYDQSPERGNQPPPADMAWKKSGVPINGETASDQSGFSIAVAADGSCLVVGSPYHDHKTLVEEESTLTNAGQARVFYAEKSSPFQKSKG